MLLYGKVEEQRETNQGGGGIGFIQTDLGMLLARPTMVRASPELSAHRGFHSDIDS
jgi:hypothetical protein